MYHVAYLYNRTISRVVNNRSLYEIFFDHPPIIYNLKRFGCEAHSQIHKVNRNSKLLNQAERGVCLSIKECLYRVYFPRTRHIVLNKHVSFNENVYPMTEANE